MVTKLLLVAGIAGPILFVAGFWFLGWRRPGYNPWYTFASQLGLNGGGLVWRTVNVISGLLIAAFGFGLRETATGDLASWSGCAVIVGGVGFAIFGISYDDPWLLYPPGAPPGISTPVTLHGWGHQVGALIAFIGLESAHVLFAYCFALHGDGSALVYSVLTAVGFPALYAGAVVSAVASWVPTHPWRGKAGLFQKASIAASLVWVAWLAAHFVSLPGGP